VFLWGVSSGLYYVWDVNERELGVVLTCVHTLVCPWVPVVSSSGFSCVSLGADLCVLLGVCAVSFTPVHCFMKRSTVFKICHCHIIVNIFRCLY
jgi:hypothetical protein